MLKQRDKDVEVIGEGFVLVGVDHMAAAAQAIAEKLSNISQGIDEYVPLSERLSEFIEEPDKGAGFVLVGNDTWLPKPLVNARKFQQRKASRVAETGIVWTKR